jgi:hypothetical protein
MHLAPLIVHPDDLFLADAEISEVIDPEAASGQLVAAYVFPRIQSFLLNHLVRIFLLLRVLSGLRAHLVIEDLHDEEDVLLLILVLVLIVINNGVELCLSEVSLVLEVPNNDLTLHDVTVKNVPAFVSLLFLTLFLGFDDLHTDQSLACEDERILFEGVHLVYSFRLEYIQVDIVELLQS